MVQIDGTYQLVENENFVPYLQALGIPEDKAKQADSLRPKLQVSIDGNKISFHSDSGLSNVSPTYIFDQEVDEKTPQDDVVLKSIAKRDGDTVTITSKTPKGKTGRRVYKFSDTGVVLTMDNDDLATVAKRVYKKV